MKKSTIHFVLAVVTACGCQTTRAVPSRLPPPADVATAATKSTSADSNVRPVALQQPLLEPNNLQTPPVSPAIGELPSATTSTTGQLSLKDLEQLALGNNPTLAQAEARVAALRGRWVQVGLPPNPSAGYMASEIGNEGKAGQQGGYVGQEFITGGKLGLNRSVVSQEIQRAEQEMAAVQMRVQTDVRKAYYAALLAQRRNDLAAELLRVSTRAAEASQELFNVAGEIPRPALLQTQIEQQNAAIFVQTAEQERLASRRQLSAVVGMDVTSAQLTGDVTQLPTLLNWDEQLARVTSVSPEMAAAFASISRAQTALQRARVEPIPDVATQFIVQRDNATEDTIAGVQVGMPLPAWNRNQGGIRQAEADIIEARRNADRVALDLKRRLAIAFETYSTAHAQAEIYSTQILPKSQETFNLVQRGYTLGELGYLDYLSAQRTYSQANLAYLEALSRLWASWNEIEGLLLSDSLSAGQPTQ